MCAPLCGGQVQQRKPEHLTGGYAQLISAHPGGELAAAALQLQFSHFQAAFMNKKISVRGKKVNLSIWDTAGQERFHALGPIYYRDSHGKNYLLHRLSW